MAGQWAACPVAASACAVAASAGHWKLVTLPPVMVTFPAGVVASRQTV
jgi:hypothetical protein